MKPKGLYDRFRKLAVPKMKQTENNLEQFQFTWIKKDSGDM